MRCTPCNNWNFKLCTKAILHGMCNAHFSISEHEQASSISIRQSDVRCEALDKTKKK